MTFPSWPYEWAGYGVAQEEIIEEYEVLQAKLLQVLYTWEANQGLFQGYRKGEPHEGILDYIHSDVWGAAPTKSYGGARYYVTFMDVIHRIFGSTLCGRNLRSL